MLVLCASSPYYLLIMSEEAAVHIGPEINCDDVEVVNNEINFICCKCSKKVMLHWIYSIVI